MYSWEITEFLKSKHYELSACEYKQMIKHSTQIARIKYNPYSNSFDMWDDSGMHWSFKVFLTNN